MLLVDGRSSFYIEYMYDVFLGFWGSFSEIQTVVLSSYRSVRVWLAMHMVGLVGVAFSINTCMEFFEALGVRFFQNSNLYDAFLPIVR